MLDNISSICDTVRCQIRVEQEILSNVKVSAEIISDPTKSDAPSSEIRQGGPQPHVQGTPSEIRRSTKETEKVVLSGGRMESHDGRS